MSPIIPTPNAVLALEIVDRLVRRATERIDAAAADGVADGPDRAVARLLLDEARSVVQTHMATVIKDQATSDLIANRAVPRVREILKRVDAAVAEQGAG